MHSGVNAYSKTAQATVSPRELEANLLMKAATKFQRIMDDWDVRKIELDEALTYNRKLWTILVTSATDPENPLPREIKQNIANLAAFIFKRTFEVMAEPAVEKLNILVFINKNIAAGLRGSAS
jgi:flagellar biosynthesis activator protein FlaF